MLRTIKRSYTKFNPEFFKPMAGSGEAISSPKFPMSTSTSQDEMKHFSDLAPSWWDVSGPQRILHKMNLARMDFIQKTLREQYTAGPETYVPGFNYKAFLPRQIAKAIENELDQDIHSQLYGQKLEVLDIGCGGGILAESLARMPFVSKVKGIDLTPECIEIAESHALKDPSLTGKLAYEVQSLEEVAGSYDLVTCLEMLEHVDHPSEILRHAWSRLKEGGILVVSTINRDPISWFTTIFVAEQVLKLVPRGTHHVSKYINSEEIKQWFQEECSGQHQVLNCKGAMYVPLSGWSEHDYSGVGNYFMAIKKVAE
ncbi:LAME_0F06656g1_1 [Lachancea meyersii CBS 8951]|uniref:Ubiquinone biosynthesis O-methyltransferase, mitochondrial n=1 Tax=Lachancea meyersii CBS 8951 TaxID=1266667 RepID=A0A1G4JTK1_9SACH|nr:LAME_0F06656g1_1 [Lachancea meyersii CBS 8951]